MLNCSNQIEMYREKVSAGLVWPMTSRSVKRPVIFLFMWGILWIRKKLPPSQFRDNNGYNSQPFPSTHVRFTFNNIVTDFITPFISSRVDSVSRLVNKFRKVED